MNIRGQFFTSIENRNELTFYIQEKIVLVWFIFLIIIKIKHNIKIQLNQTYEIETEGNFKPFINIISSFYFHKFGIIMAEKIVKSNKNLVYWI